VERATRRGLNARLIYQKEAKIESGELIAGSFISDILYRRTHSFSPPSIEQPVMNDLRTREIAANKWRLYQELKGKVRQPPTWYARDL
jgi:predicted ATP-grasp superfamily ATP-dependent carboligase